MIHTYDIIIIGAGSGGLNVAGFFSRLSLRILLIDKNSNRIGGDCLNTGCVPSKALIHIANQVHDAKKAEIFLHDRATVASQVDIKKVTDYITAKQSEIRESENVEYLQKKGISFIEGEAFFVDTKTVQVGTDLYTAKHIVLATGSRPRKSGIENDNSVSEYTNETIFTIDVLPKNIVCIGGGPISCELGQAFSRLGSKVTILTTGSRILEKETEEVSGVLESVFEKEGIRVVKNAVVEKIASGSVHYNVSGSTESLQVDAVFWGIGRDLALDDSLGLDKAGIMKHENGSKLIVDEYLRTTNKNVYVVGDVAGNYQFTHAAEMHANVVITNMLSPRKKTFSAKHIAWVTYTSPEIATFGIQKSDAESKGLEVIRYSFSHDDRAIIDENQQGFVEVYIDKKGYIHGGTMVGNNAGELVQELILAMSTKVSLSQIFTKVYPYPSASRVNKSLAGVWEERRLGKFTKIVLKYLYKI